MSALSLRFELALDRESAPKVDKDYNKDLDKGLPGSVTH